MFIEPDPVVMDRRPEQRLAPGVHGGPAGQRVLDHRVLDLGRREADAKVRELLDRQPAEVGREDRVGRREALGQLGDRLGLVGSVQWVTSIMVLPARAGGSRGPWRDSGLVANLARAARRACRCRSQAPHAHQ